MKQEERRQQTIQQLLDATKRLVHEIGCQSITMNHIIEKSGLSKGAIFHYVKSKDEIFAWVLQEGVEKTNLRFIDEVEKGKRDFEGPMRKIAEAFSALDQADDMTNKVFVYLLGKEHDPAIAQVLQQFHDRSVALARNWIETGQRSGVIPVTMDVNRTAEMFVVLSLGLRARSSIPGVTPAFTAQDFTKFVVQTLKPNR
ncbi:TetR family transcriptional regulator [Paenibacillus swuensis]|uniref:TetR family transcriptional regulator n=1 Tax=Paenibacillus swuensis TaxID=1178515 RepID=A0A172TIP4_9BACL|nr:TetR/AcrR family transcriptional regulator [Paenibacillus swuensis]ANE46880.1 TetR family transcriptional regulator [Paenibacillus swuensis]